MKVLLLAQFFPPMIGGEERHVLNLSTELAARGHDVAVATQQVSHDNGLPAARWETLPSGVRVHRLRSALMSVPGVYSVARRPFHAPLPDPVVVRGLARVLAAERPTVVHAHNWIVNSAVAVRRRSPRFGLVLTLHDYSHVCATKRLMRAGAPCPGPAPRSCWECSGDFYGPVMGPATYAATQALRVVKDHAVDRIVTVSRAVAEGNGLIARGTPHEVIPNFVPDRLLDAAPPSGPPDPELPEGEFLLFAGDLSQEKGVLTLLEAYAGLGPGRPPLLLIGRPCPDTPQQVPAGARIATEWPHERVMEAFRRCVLAALPSTWPDPCPTTVLEAMAAGKPVITTATGGMLDMVDDGVSGFLVPPGDPSALRDRIAALLADPHLRARLGWGARERAARFTASSVAERLEAVYASCSPGPP